MIKDNLFTYLRVLNSTNSAKANVKFRYAVARNIKILQSEIKFIEDFEKRSEKFTEYETKRVELCEELAEKNESGKSIKFINDKGEEVYKFNEENGKIIKEKIDVLREEYKEVIEKEDQRLKDLTDLLNEEAQVELYKIPTDIIPEDVPQAFWNLLLDDIIVEKL